MNRTALAWTVVAAIVIAVVAALVLVQDAPDAPEAQGQDMEGGDEMDASTLTMTVNGTTFIIALEDNETAKTLASMMPLEIRMSELNGNEKYCYLDKSLPIEPYRPGTIHAGDVMLFGDDCLVVFYDTFMTSYSYTPIGHVTYTSSLAAALGPGGVSATFEIRSA